jgi:hypothetical protein
MLPKFARRQAPFAPNTQCQLLSDGTLQLQGDQTITCRILKLNGWSMITTSTTDSGLAVRWIKLPKINAKAILLIAMAVLLPILVRHLFRTLAPLTQSLTILSTRRQIPQVTAIDKRISHAP